MKKTTVMLTGGLGNQMFQIVAGISLCNSSELFVETKLGKPRMSINGNPDLFEFKLFDNLKVISKKYSYFISKVCGYNLRIGVSPRDFEKNYLWKKIISFCSFLILSLYFREPTIIINDERVSQFNKYRKFNKLLVGYFQNIDFISGISQEELNNLFSVKSESLNLIKLAKDSDKKDIVIIHVRLGDYNFEPEIGILSQNYYTNAINKIENSAGIEEIWLFSNEINKAINYFPENYKSRIHSVEQKIETSAELLQVMTLGKHYIIANSTLSWWAAFLGASEKSIVISPYPWFKLKNEKSNFIPQSWERIDGWK